MALPGKRGHFSGKSGFNNLEGDNIDFERGERFAKGDVVTGYDWYDECAKRFEVRDSYYKQGKHFIEVYDESMCEVKEVELDD